MRGLIMDMPLLVSSLIAHADRSHGDTEIVSRTVEGPGKDGAGAVHRYTYSQAHKRSKQLAQALLRLGVKEGERVGTLAWNGYRHFELYYGVSGMGAVVHTVNPRLFHEQLVYIVNHAEDAYVFFDLTLRPARGKARARVQGGEGLGGDDRPRPHAGRQAAEPALLRRAARARGRRLRLAAVRRVDRGGPVLQLGHHRSPQGRALRQPLHHPARLRVLDAGRVQLLGALGDPARGADVPRQRVGHSLFRAAERREARVSRSGARRQEPVRAVRVGKGDGDRRRPHRMAQPARLSQGERPQVQHAAESRGRRLGLPAGDDHDLPRRVRRALPARLGNDRDEPARRLVHA